MSTRLCFRTNIKPRQESQPVEIPPNARSIWVLPSKPVTASTLYLSQSGLVITSAGPKFNTLNVIAGNQLLAFGGHGVPLCPDHKFVRWQNGNSIITNPATAGAANQNDHDVTFLFEID